MLDLGPCNIFDCNLESTLICGEKNVSLVDMNGSNIMRSGRVVHLQVKARMVDWDDMLTREVYVADRRTGVDGCEICVKM